MPDCVEDRPRQVRGQPRAGTRPVVRVQRERLLPALQVETAEDGLVDESLGMLTYFADPYSSYQRGSNENRNGRIRRYLPKRTGFDDLTDEDLQAIVQEINDTPMKVLDWETPNEVWYRELGKAMSKTSHPRTSVALTN